MLVSPLQCTKRSRTLLLRRAEVYQANASGCSGYESTFTVDFLSHFLLTLQLLPNFNQNARIINVSSTGHYNAARKHFDANDIDSAKYIEQKGFKEGGQFDAPFALEIYGKAKAAQVLFTLELQKRLDQGAEYGSKKLVVQACHPGLVKSSIWGRNIKTGSEKYNASLGTFTKIANFFGSASLYC